MNPSAATGKWSTPPTSTPRPPLGPLSSMSPSPPTAPPSSSTASAPTGRIGLSNQTRKGHPPRAPSLFHLASAVLRLRTPYHRVRLNLHQHLRRNQRTNLHHTGRRPNCSKKFSVSPPNLFP